MQSCVPLCHSWVWTKQRSKAATNFTSHWFNQGDSRGSEILQKYPRVTISFYCGQAGHCLSHLPNLHKTPVSVGALSVPSPQPPQNTRFSERSWKLQALLLELNAPLNVLEGSPKQTWSSEKLGKPRKSYGTALTLRSSS